MLGRSDVVAFVATARPEQSRAFYRDTLGLRLVADEPYALVFDANGTTLRVARVAAHAPAPHTVLGWSVRSIDDVVARLVERDVPLARFPALHQDATGVWTAPGGARVAWFHDPDGNLLSVTEHPAG